MKKLIFAALALAVLIAPVRADAGLPESGDEARAAPGADVDAVKLPILMYHQISEDFKRWNDYVVSVDEFESDMDFLRDNGYDTISLKELLAWYDGAFTMPEKPVMVTFDDGFESTLRYAEPILAGHGFCGVVAVIGSVCGEFSRSGEAGFDWSYLSWEEAAEMSGRGVIEVQCHTYDLHELEPRLGCGRMEGEDEEEYARLLTEDLSEFLAECEYHGVTLTPAVAYPFGEYCEKTTETIKKLGFRAAFTCDEKINLLTGDGEELYHLYRFNREHGWDGLKIFYFLEESY